MARPAALALTGILLAGCSPQAGIELRQLVASAAPRAAPGEPARERVLVHEDARALGVELAPGSTELGVVLHERADAQAGYATQRSQLAAGFALQAVAARRADEGIGRAP